MMAKKQAKKQLKKAIKPAKKAAPKKAVPKKPAPKKPTPKKAAPKKQVAQKTAPKKAAPKKSTPKKSAPKKTPSKRPRPTPRRAPKLPPSGETELASAEVALETVAPPRPPKPAPIATKPLKDMTPEEFREYKKGAAKRHSLKVKNAKETAHTTAVANKLSGKAKASWENRDKEVVRPFAEAEDGTSYMINVDERGGFFFAGLNLFLELLGNVDITGPAGKGRKVFLNIGLAMKSTVDIGNYLYAKSIWQFDVTDKLGELNDKNFHSLLKHHTVEVRNEVDKLGTLKEFAHHMLRLVKDKRAFSEYLYYNMDAYRQEELGDTEEFREFNPGKVRLRSRKTR